MDKIIIIGDKNTDLTPIAHHLIRIDNNMSITCKFTSDINFKDMNRDNNINGIYYQDNDTILLDYQNNSLMYVVTTDYMSKGITLDEYTNANISMLDISEFNNISDKTLNMHPIVIVWVDTRSKHSNYNGYDETKFLMDRIYNYPYMYFVDEDPRSIANVIYDYVTTESEEHRKDLLEENS